MPDRQLHNPHEAWRVRYAGSVFTAYLSGTLYCNGGDAPELSFVYGKIAELTGTAPATADSEILIGLDETGKGEVLGHAALAAVKVRVASVPLLDKIIGSVDTKSRKSFSFWDGIIKELDALRGRGLEYEVETLPPWDIDKYNVNKILDVVYQRLLARMLHGEDSAKVSVTVDDYGIGANMDRYLHSLSAAGATVRVEAKADIHYPEVRAASIVSKWRRELAMKGIGERFSFPEQPIGSGNAGDPLTKAWLQRWKATGKPWPWFVKTSFRNIREMDGRSTPVSKSDPPIRHDLLSPESSRLFNEGRLSTASLTIVCPNCGRTASAAKLTPAPGSGGLEGRCVGCGEVIPDLETTLRYYCGVAVPDSSVLITGAISTDLDQKGFFGGFSFLLPSVVSRETDQPGGRRELGRLGDFAAMGRISMRPVATDVPDDASRRDAVVIGAAKDWDAILVTRDLGMYGHAISEHVFTLTFRLPS